MHPIWLAASTKATSRALAQIAAERIAQDAKWGEQNHPDGTGPDVRWQMPSGMTAAELAAYARKRCEWAAAEGRTTWLGILLEEIAETFTEADPAALRAELVQVAAVAVAWIEAIDRRTVQPEPSEAIAAQASPEPAQEAAVDRHAMLRLARRLRESTFNAIYHTTHAIPTVSAAADDRIRENARVWSVVEAALNALTEPDSINSDGEQWTRLNLAATVRWHDDDPQLICHHCDDLVCSIEGGDDLEVLARTTASHIQEWHADELAQQQAAEDAKRLLDEVTR